jgi:hypothetical protein
MTEDTKMRNPSAKRIQTTFNLTAKQAKKLKQFIEDGDVDKALDAANDTIGGYGVESIEGENFISHYYQHIALLYVNMGETYASTIWYDTENECFGIGSWGDWLEYSENKGLNTFQ